MRTLSVCAIIWATSVARAATEFSRGTDISVTSGEARFVLAADLDGDGDPDVLSASYRDNVVVWHENTDGLGSFSLGTYISTTAQGVTGLFAGDLDGDGDLDVLSASTNDDLVVWYENTDGLGNFAAGTTISTTADGANHVVAADLDGDGDLDVLSASVDDDRVVWYENTDGLGSFSLGTDIDVTAGRATSVFAADIDGDGDLDVLSTAHDSDRVAWYENTNGLGSFSLGKNISTTANGARMVIAADMDGDGDLDVLYAASENNQVGWYDNVDGLGSFSLGTVISEEAKGARAIFAADLDNDGDLDVVSASSRDDRVVWYENTDSLGSFSPALVISNTTTDATSVFAADLDGDGDLDLLSASWGDDRIAWYENLLVSSPSPGTGRKGSTSPDSELIIGITCGVIFLVATLGVLYRQHKRTGCISKIHGQSPSAGVHPISLIPSTNPGNFNRRSSSDPMESAEVEEKSTIGSIHVGRTPRTVLPSPPHPLPVPPSHSTDIKKSTQHTEVLNMASNTSSVSPRFNIVSQPPLSYGRVPKPALRPYNGGLVAGNEGLMSVELPSSIYLGELPLTARPGAVGAKAFGTNETLNTAAPAASARGGDIAVAVGDNWSVLTHAVGAAAQHVPWIWSIFGLLNEIIHLMEEQHSMKNLAKIDHWAKSWLKLLVKLNGYFENKQRSPLMDNKTLGSNVVTSLSHLVQLLVDFKKKCSLVQFVMSTCCQKALQQGDADLRWAISSLTGGLEEFLHQVQGVQEVSLEINRKFDAYVESQLEQEALIARNNEEMAIRLSEFMKVSTSSSEERHSHNGSEASLKRGIVEVQLEDLDRLQIRKRDVVYPTKVPFASGAYSQVFQVLHEGDVRVAKVTNMEKLGITDKRKLNKVFKSFVTELSIMARIDSPSVIKVHGAVVDPGELTLILDYAERGSLLSVLQKDDARKQMSPHRQSIITDITAGMTYLYSQGVQHRDLKSPNVLITEAWRAKITDFGLSKTKVVISSSITTSNFRGGTTGWKAPELMRFGGGGTGPFTEKSDVYSFGVIVWEIMCGEGLLPWENYPKDEVGRLVVIGEHLQIPRDCLLLARKLMLDCWQTRPGDRPSFLDILCQLQLEVWFP